MTELIEGQALAAVPTAIAVALSGVTARLFRSERIIFGRSA